MIWYRSVVSAAIAAESARMGQLLLTLAPQPDFSWLARMSFPIFQ